MNPDDTRAPSALDVQPGDIVALRKPHPCGSVNWEVTRTGADVGLKCLTCGKRILLPVYEFRSKFRRIVRQGNDPSP